jgi:hypothetical protein
MQESRENEMNVRARMLATVTVIAFLAPLPLLRGQTLLASYYGSTTQAETSPSDQDAATPTATGSRRHDGTPKVELFLGYSRFAAGSNETTGTVGNRIVDMNGGDAALAFNFTRHFALVADFGGYDASQLQLTGSGANQPRTVNASGTAFTYMFGPKISFRKERQISPFFQALGGGLHASQVTVAGCTGTSCSPLPQQNALSVAIGGGLDIRLSHSIALRPIEAEYMMTRFSTVPGGVSGSQNDLRLSSGLVFRFGGRSAPADVGLTCSVQQQNVNAGDVVFVTASATNLDARHASVYAWSATGGTVSGSGASVSVNTGGVAPGTYMISGTITEGNHPAQKASCSASFMILSPQLSPAPAPQPEPSAPPAPVAKVETPAPPPPPAALPTTRELCEVSFERDRRRPVRVDNEAKACLDDVSLQMQRESGGSLVFVGEYSAGENSRVAEERAKNVRQYLAVEKGIDSRRIEIRIGAARGRKVHTIFVPVGAIYTASDTTVVSTQ